MSSENLRRNLESRILSTLKINPSMSYNEAIETVLQSLGICLSFSVNVLDEPSMEVLN